MDVNFHTVAFHHASPKQRRASPLSAWSPPAVTTPLAAPDAGPRADRRTARAAVLAGVSSALPPHIVTNDDLAATGLDTSDEWIRTRTGIRARRHVAEGTLASDLATEAGARALQAAGIDHVGAVVVASTTPDRIIPGTAPLVASRLGLGTICAFDVQAVCSGFVYGLGTAAGLIAAGIADDVLLIAAEVLSPYLDPEDRTVTVLFGDGAGAAVLRVGDPDEPGALGPFDLGSDGRGQDLITIPAGATELPAHRVDPAARTTYLGMEGREVYRQAIPRMVESSRTVLAARGWEPGDVDYLVAHQANSRIIEAVADKIGVRESARVVTIAQVGNTSAASIPLALAETRPEPGSRVLMTAFGGGLTWGSTALVWPDVAIVAHDDPLHRSITVPSTTNGGTT